MSTDKLEPATPSAEFNDDGSFYRQHFGLTAREHAAIALRVPDSGNDWLDAMIRTARRNDLAARALPGVITAIMGHEGHNWQNKDFAHEAYAMADAMLSASAARPEDV